MNSLTVHIYHNKTLSLNEIESFFIPIFGHVYSYSILLNMSDHIWSAYINNNLIGCVLTKSSDDSSTLYLILFGIKQIYQSMKIGSHLLSTIINYSRKSSHKNIYLHTECTNKRAIGFYEKFHFHVNLFIENYYQTMASFYPHAFQMKMRV
jgi:ribosomal protein S18 acetylase RimI-like enzyme